MFAFKSRVLSDEALAGATLSPLALCNKLLLISHVIVVKVIEIDKTKEYNSIRAAARELDVSH